MGRRGVIFIPAGDPGCYNLGAPPVSGPGTLYPIAISWTTARAWFRRSIWQITAADSTYEADSLGNLNTGGGSGSGEWEKGAGCDSEPSTVFTYPTAQTNYTGPNNCNILLDLPSGYRDGDTFWPKISITVGSIWTTLSTANTGYGTPSFQIGGIAIPSVSTWLPGWRFNPGYANGTTMQVSLH